VDAPSGGGAREQQLAVRVKATKIILLVEPRFDTDQPDAGCIAQLTVSAYSARQRRVLPSGLDRSK